MAPPADKVLSWLDVLGCSILLILIAGVPFGYTGIKPALIDSKLFHYLCDSDTTLNPDGTCAFQMVRMDTMFTVASFGFNTCTIFVGMGHDYFGHRTWCMIGTLLAAVSLVGYGISLYITSPFWVTTLSYLFFTLPLIGGGAVFVSMLSTPTTFPLSVSSSLMTVMWDISTAILVIMNSVYFATGWSLGAIIIVYSVVVGAGSLLFIYRTIPHPPGHHQKKKIQSAEDEKPTTYVGSLLPYMWRPMYAMVVIVNFLNLLPMYLYLATVREQAENLGGDGVHYGFVFSVLLFALAPLTGLVGVPMDWLNKAVGTADLSVLWVVMGVTSGAWGLLSVVPVPALQYATYCLFIPWRMCFFIINNIYFATWYPSEIYGRTMTISISIGGLVASIVSGPLTKLIVEEGKQTLVNLLLTIACVVASLLWAAALYHQHTVAQKKKRALPADETTPLLL